MKKLLLVLALLGVVSQAQAQEYTSRYFHYDVYFDAPAPFSIKANTIDGADTNAMLLSGGGAAGTTRGAYIGIYGNEYSGTGGLLLGSGDAIGADIKLATGGIEHFSIPLSITSTATLTYGLSTDVSPGLVVRSKKADAADDSYVQITAGGAWGTTRGAGVQFLGDDYGGAGAGGGVLVETGTGTANSFNIQQVGVNKLSVSATSDLDDVTIVLGTNVTTAPLFNITAATSDGDDDGVLCLTAGGACTSIGRGSFIRTYGTDHSTEPARIDLIAGGARPVFVGSSAYAWTTDADFDATPLFSIAGSGSISTQVGLFGTGNNATGFITAYLKTRASTLDANTIVQASDGLMDLRSLAADGVVFRTAARIMTRVEAGSTPASNDIAADIAFFTSAAGGAVNARERWRISSAGVLEQNATYGGGISMLKAGSTITINGTIDSTANDIGWRAAAAANQACTTTCGAGKGCVFGYDITTTAVVDCSNAAADSCICTTT